MVKVDREILILGIGNEILMDDGIGPGLVLELQKEILNPNVGFITAAAGGLDILELIKDYRQVIIIDAIKTSFGIPGTVYHFTPSDFRETLHVSSFHDISFLTALKLGDKLNLTLPQQIDILAIEIAEDMIFGSEFSPLIKSKFGSIYGEIKTEIKRLIQ